MPINTGEGDKYFSDLILAMQREARHASDRPKPLPTVTYGKQECCIFTTDRDPLHGTPRSEPGVTVFIIHPDDTKRIVPNTPINETIRYGRLAEFRVNARIDPNGLEVSFDPSPPILDTQEHSLLDNNANYIALAEPFRAALIGLAAYRRIRHASGDVRIYIEDRDEKFNRKILLEKLVRDVLTKGQMETVAYSRGRRKAVTGTIIEFSQLRIPEKTFNDIFS